MMTPSLSDVRVLRSALLALVLGSVAIGLTGCDSGGANTLPDPEFEATLGPPVNTSLSGKAALGDVNSFQNSALFSFAVPGLEKTITAVQLFGTGENSTSHDLSFTYIADERLSEGTYTLDSAELELPFDSTRARSHHSGPPVGPDSLFTASYGRQTTDSLFTYNLEGSVTIENVGERVVEGRFDLEAPVEISISRDSLKAHIESLRGPHTGPISPPPFTIRPLDEPMSIEGTFTATPREFADDVTHARWLAPGS